MLEIINAIETSYSECCSTKNDKSRRSIYEFRNIKQAIKKASDCCLEVVNKEEEDDKSIVSSIETSEIPDTTPMEEEAEQNQFVFVGYFLFFMSNPSSFNECTPTFIERSSIHDLCSKQIASLIKKENWIQPTDSIMV